MKTRYTKRQILESIKHWKNVLESKLDLDDDLGMSNAHDVAHIDQNLKGFASVFIDNDVTLRNGQVELVANALYYSIDPDKLKERIAMLKKYKIGGKAVKSLESLAYFVKCMDEFNRKNSLDGFEDDVY